MSVDYIPKYPGDFTGEYVIQATESHLQLLALFLYLLRHVEDFGHQHPSNHDSLYGKRVFLVSVEARYAQYLDLASRTADPYEIPLPPWDVAIIMHAHMLSPVRFQKDIQKERWKIQSSRLEFPLKRLARLMDMGVWSDPASELQWEKEFSQPYQQWTTYPISEDERLPYQPFVTFNCLICESVSEIAFDSWLALRLRTSREEGALCLTCCGSVEDHGFLEYSFREVSQDSSTHGVSSYKGFSSSSAINGAQDNKIPCKTIRTNNKDGFSALSKVSENAPHAIWPTFSLDLVEAALRQEKFALKITSLYPSSPNLDTSLPRYLKFMNLMSNTKTILVPHLDIDLFWHTHQLSGHVYDQFCYENFGKLIDHDDTLSHDDLAEGLENTERAWKDVYHEEYGVYPKRESKSMGEKLFPVEMTDGEPLVIDSTRNNSASAVNEVNASSSMTNNQPTSTTNQQEQKMRSESLTARHLSTFLQSQISQKIAQAQKLVDSIYQRTQSPIDEANNEYAILLAELLPVIETTKTQIKSISEELEEVNQTYSLQTHKHSLFRRKEKAEKMESEKEIHELRLALEERSTEVRRLEAKVEEAKVMRDGTVEKVEGKRKLLTTQAHAGLGERVKVLNERRQKTQQELYEKYGDNPACWDIWKSGNDDFEDPYQNLEDAPPDYEEATDSTFIPLLDNLSTPFVDDSLSYRRKLVPPLFSSISTSKSKIFSQPEKPLANKLTKQKQVAATPPVESSSSGTFRVISASPATAESRKRDKEGKDQYGAGLSIFDMIFGPNKKGELDSLKARNLRGSGGHGGGAGCGGGCGG